MRSLFLYSNPLDFGQPEYSGFGAGESWSDDEHISRYLEIGGNDVRRYDNTALSVPVSLIP